MGNPGRVLFTELKHHSMKSPFFGKSTSIRFKITIDSYFLLNKGNAQSNCIKKTHPNPLISFDVGASAAETSNAKSNWKQKQRIFFYMSKDFYSSPRNRCIASLKISWSFRQHTRLNEKFCEKKMSGSQQSENYNFDVTVQQL